MKSKFTPIVRVFLTVDNINKEVLTGDSDNECICTCTPFMCHCLPFCWFATQHICTSDDDLSETFMESHICWNKRSIENDVIVVRPRMTQIGSIYCLDMKL